jgi:hypothetical protein
VRLLLIVMAANGKYFDVEEFNNWKRKHGASNIPPRANFVAAANYIRNFFDARKFNWAAMLGLAMACLGSRREMPDLHIVYDDMDFQRIKMKLEADQRYVVDYQCCAFGPDGAGCDYPTA